MATTFTTLVAQARTRLIEASATYWSDAELFEYALKGAKDLWRRINDLYEGYFITIDTTNVTLAANSSQLSGVPADLFRVVSIEPRILGESSANPGLIFEPQRYNHPLFKNARAESAIEPKNNKIFYEVFSAGPPVGTAIIRVAPQVSSVVNLTVVYNQTLSSSLVIGSDNPIPGESDNAIVAWTVAYARAKETDDRSPDVEWYAVYQAELAKLITALAPRQIQEPEVVEGVFDGFGMW